MSYFIQFSIEVILSIFVSLIVIRFLFWVAFIRKF